MLYLRKTKFTGFTKWCIINRVVQEEHPHEHSLIEVLRRADKAQLARKQAKAEGKKLPEEPLDPILAGLLKTYTDGFLRVSETEEATLLQRQLEYQVLSRKSVHISYMFFNLSQVQNLPHVINVYAHFIGEIKRAHETFESRGQKRHDYEERINDFDKLATEILNVLVTMHLCNLVQKFRAASDAHRQDAWNSARLLAALCHQLINERKIHKRQFD